MSYCVDIVYGNGYSCSCCRSESRSTEYFDTYEEALEFVADMRFKRDNSERLRKVGDNVNTDFYIERLYLADESDGIDDDKVAKLQEEMEAKLKKREANAKRAAKARATKAKKTKEANERKKLAALKEKYEGAEQ